MGIMAYSLEWVMQDLYHQPYDKGSTRTPQVPFDRAPVVFNRHHLGYVRG